MSTFRSTSSPHMRTPVRQSPRKKREEDERLRSQEKERREAEEKLKSEEKKQPVAMKTASFYSSAKPMLRTPDPPENNGHPDHLGHLIHPDNRNHPDHLTTHDHLGPLNIRTALTD